ncbi:MAG: hypothetical protein ACYST3_10130 [Planctomycetota bacterium]|jgi:hypothetical protein
MMQITHEHITVTKVSYWGIFRFTFVISYLSLTGELFYRWDGFRYYYASFSELPPTFALVAMFWSIIAVFAALLVWLSVKILSWFYLRIGRKIAEEDLLFFMGIFVLLGTVVWATKLLVFGGGSTLLIKMAVLCAVILTAIFLTSMFQNRIGRWIGIVQKRITPLVWLFGILTMLSVPFIGYYTFMR